MKNAATQSGGLVVAADVQALLRARNPLLWVTTGEEARVEKLLIEAAAAAGYVPRMWDVAQGVTDMAGKTPAGAFQGCEDPGAMLATIRARATDEAGTPERTVWILRDLPVWLAGPPGAALLRLLRNLTRLLPGVPRERAQAIIVLTASGEVPAELTTTATVVEFPLPDRIEIAAILDAAIASLPEDLRATAAPNGTREAAIDAAIGLSGAEAQACYAKSLVSLRKIDPAMVAQEKRRVVARDGVLEWYDPIPGGLDAVGGLDLLKEWLKARSIAYSAKARAYGLPAPKGGLLVGVPGCGKSLTAKACATAYGVPLLRIDLGALRSKFVGDSEANLRKALATIGAVGRCVVWLDEIEKALQGATSGSADGGVSADALGTILSWMQERQGEAFVVATANDVSSLPPELLRKGRFDEVWFVDLPTADERASILAAAIRAHGRDPRNLDGEAPLEEVASKTQGFTGAEIAALVPEAMFTAFADGGREPTTADILRAARDVVPLSTTAKEKIADLRKWANERARLASRVVYASEARASDVRALDL